MLLYYITDRKSFTGTDTQQREALLRQIADAARAGVDYIQLREKDLSAHELERLAHAAMRAVRNNSAGAKLLINTRADVALAVGADGVHLPAGELTASEVRALWMWCGGSNPLIGLSAHGVADIRAAEEQTADFAVLAPIFEKAYAGTPGIGVQPLCMACAGSQPEGDDQGRGHFPVLALGGVTSFNARACIEAGAAGVAGIRLFQQGDVFETVRRLRRL